MRTTWPKVFRDPIHNLIAFEDTPCDRLLLDLINCREVQRLRRIKQLGFEGEVRPIKVSCADHEGARVGRIQTWDGKDWKISSDWYTSNDSVIAPMVKDTAAKYAAEKKLTPGCLVTN